MSNQIEDENFVESIEVPEKIANYYEQQLTEVSIALTQALNKRKARDIKISKRTISTILAMGGFQYAELIVYSSFSIVVLKEKVTQKTVIREEYDVKLEKLMHTAQFLWVNEVQSEKKTLMRITDIIQIAKMGSWNLSQNWAELFELYILEQVEIDQIRSTIKAKQKKAEFKYEEDYEREFKPEGRAIQMIWSNLKELATALQLASLKLAELKSKPKV